MNTYAQTVKYLSGLYYVNQSSQPKLDFHAFLPGFFFYHFALQCSEDYSVQRVLKDEL
ncbi:hypothetical protein I79_018984 [Cricetulus griseus]|uniref:Uncharacterized protein n=1 Tax=Cricetulus griseus TaxID=10029 RepID=G3I672_CRIGR|nr:hypothetical protein I79_018984 [Cricetulus griseus]